MEIEKLGTWGDHLELVALAHIHRANVKVMAVKIPTAADAKSPHSDPVITPKAANSKRRCGSNTKRGKRQKTRAQKQPVAHAKDPALTCASCGKHWKNSRSLSLHQRACQRSGGMIVPERGPNAPKNNRNQSVTNELPSDVIGGLHIITGEIASVAKSMQEVARTCASAAASPTISKPDKPQSTLMEDDVDSTAEPNSGHNETRSVTVLVERVMREAVSAEKEHIADMRTLQHTLVRNLNDAGNDQMDKIILPLLNAQKAGSNALQQPGLAQASAEAASLAGASNETSISRGCVTHSAQYLNSVGNKPKNISKGTVDDVCDQIGVWVSKTTFPGFDKLQELMVTCCWLAMRMTGKIWG